MERTQDTRLPFMLRTLAKPSLPSCAAYLPDRAPAVLDTAGELAGWGRWLTAIIG